MLSRTRRILSSVGSLTSWQNAVCFPPEPMSLANLSKRWMHVLQLPVMMAAHSEASFPRLALGYRQNSSWLFPTSTAQGHSTLASTWS